MCSRPLAGVLMALLLAALLSPARAQVSVPTQHNDNARSGANLHEIVLTPADVRVASFGKLFTVPLDANVDGQVLYVPRLTVRGAVHNVIFAQTSNNVNGSPSSVYAFDGDSGALLWRHRLPASARWTTAAPVIDLGARTLYALTKDTNDYGPTRLRALDLVTGQEKPGSPVTIQGSVPGTGDGSVNGVVTFDTSHANCRSGLLLLNGTVYAAFSHMTDSFPYHGWIFGYHYTGSGFTRTALRCLSPNGGQAGIWSAGKGLAADSAGNIYCATGNGTFDSSTGGRDYGMCILRLSTPGLAVTDYFAPYNEKALSDADLDLGNVGPLLIPGTDRLFAGSTKYGVSYLLNRTDLGGFTPGGPNHIIQGLSNNILDTVGQNGVCWDTGTAKYVYLWVSGLPVQSFLYDPNIGKFSPTGPFAENGDSIRGGSLAVSANGANGGILWAAGYDGIFHAYNGANMAELWSSEQNPTRDRLGSVNHFGFPTIVSGKAYVPTGDGRIVAYGLLRAPVFRLYWAHTLDHFYTINVAEAQAVTQPNYYTREGIIGYAPRKSTSDTHPLFRLYNPATGEHFYTANATERDFFVNTRRYRYEGVAMNLFNASGIGRLPLYRLYNAQIDRHFYTTSRTEHDYVVSQLGYQDQGIPGYLYASFKRIPAIQIRPACYSCERA